VNQKITGLRENCRETRSGALVVWIITVGEGIDG
jgi:hypothetical protein